MTTMRQTILALLIVPAALWGQAVGTVTVSSTISAVAGTGTSAVTCVMSNPAPPGVHMTCAIGATVVLTQDTTPAVGATNGAGGSFVSSGNTVTWLIQQPTAGTFTWDIVANGVRKTGTLTASWPQPGTLSATIQYDTPTTGNVLVEYRHFHTEATTQYAVDSSKLIQKRAVTLTGLWPGSYTYRLTSKLDDYNSDSRRNAWVKTGNFIVP